MKQWLLRVRPARLDMLTQGPTEDEMKTIGEHFAYWKSLTEKGIAFVVGRTQTTGPETVGLAIFRAEDEQAAAGIALADPAVAAGVFLHQVDPYAVALMGDPEPFRPST